MTHNDLYLELSNKVGAGHSSIIREIWGTVCSREEATLLNALPATAEELVQRLGREHFSRHALYAGSIGYLATKSRSSIN